MPVVYLAESAALAMLEVHFSADADDDIPDNFQLLEIDYSKGRSIARLQLKSLPDNWTHSQDITRAIGDEWPAGCTSAVLKVPNAIVPGSFN